MHNIISEYHDFCYVSLSDEIEEKLCKCMQKNLDRKDNLEELI